MEVLRKPLLTEKVAQLTEKLNRYAFIVDPRANKIQIKAAIEKMYGVNIHRCKHDALCWKIENP
jgi:large subunit ribosomal protein L23